MDVNDLLIANQSLYNFCRDHNIKSKFDGDEFILIMMKIAPSLMTLFTVLTVSTSRYILLEIEHEEPQFSQMELRSAMGT